MIKRFDLQTEWEAFLKRAALPTEDKLPEEQRREMRRAFIGGVTHMIFFNEDLGRDEWPEEDAVRALEDIKEQCKLFWEIETRKQQRQTDG